MKQTKRLAGLLLAVTVLCMFSALNCPAAEIGTREFIADGSFEQATATEQGDWTVYNSNHASKIYWADMLKTDGASGRGNNYILIEAVKAENDTCNSGLNHSVVQIEPGKDHILTLLYKADWSGTMQIRYTFMNSVHNVKADQVSKYLPPTAGSWKEYGLLLPAYEFDVAGVEEPVYADGVSLCFYNTARLAQDENGDNVSDGVTVSVGYDDVSLRTYVYNALVPNGDFTLGATGWKADKGDVVFEDGMLKITGAAGSNYASTSCIPNDVLLPDGITHMRYRLSFKYKAFNTDNSAASIANTSVGMSFTYDKNTDTDINTSYLLRNPSPAYTRELEDGWTECVYYTANKKQSNASNNSYATVPATGSKFGVQLKGVANGVTIWYDDVVVTPLPYTVEKVVDDKKSECTAVAPGDSIIVSGVAANRTSTEITPAMYIAFYSEGASGKTLVSMQSVSTVNLMMATTTDGTTTYKLQDSATLPANRSGIITSSEITVPAANDGENISMKLYVWSGSGLVPLGDAYALSEAVSAS
ncbi:MAG: hypothetical protein IJN25_07620 [Clostridia bacterium]|nr:hypothetical protein [Clostridia bacterium]